MNHALNWKLLFAFLFSQARVGYDSLGSQAMLAKFTNQIEPIHKIRKNNNSYSPAKISDSTVYCI